MKYYSQYQQDKFLNETIFKNKTDGFFIDIGASEPIDQNNTYFFEKLGWNGILIEPRIKEYEKLKQERSSYIENIAIYNKCGIEKFICCDGYIKGLSGLLAEQKTEHLNRIFNELLVYGKSVEIIEVQTITINKLLEKYNINTIDYLSIDTEGSEYKILQTIDFNKVKIKAISVENNYHESNVYNLLTKYNFEKATQIGCDDIYINKQI
jgi:FkbM family methyltransferase